jgi:hypothetical protein
LDGVTATTAELNYVDGVTSAIQTQLNGKAATTTQGTAVWEAGTSTTETIVSPAKVKAAVEALATGGGFTYNAVSGATQALDVGSYNFFDAGTLTADTTVSFSNVPTEARWTYSFVPDGVTDLSAASYDGVLYDFRTEGTEVFSIAFKPDASKMYVLSYGNDKVFQFRVPDPYNVSSAVYDGTSFSVASQDANPMAIAFKPDGKKMYMSGGNSGSVHQYTLSTAWDLSTISYDSVSFNVASQEGVPRVTFKPDGTKMYITGNASDRIHQYSLSTAWDLSTTSYDNVSFNLGSVNLNPSVSQFNESGTKMYVLSQGGDRVYQYTLSTAWNVSTASYDSVNFYVGSLDNLPYALAFGPSGKMYVGGYNDRIYQFSVGDVYSLTLPLAVENSPTNAPLIGVRASYEFFTADGGTTVTIVSEDSV